MNHTDTNRSEQCDGIPHRVATEEVQRLPLAEAILLDQGCGDVGRCFFDLLPRQPLAGRGIKKAGKLLLGEPIDGGVWGFIAIEPVPDRDVSWDCCMGIQLAMGWQREG